MKQLYSKRNEKKNVTNLNKPTSTKSIKYKQLLCKVEDKIGKLKQL